MTVLVIIELVPCFLSPILSGSTTACTKDSRMRKKTTTPTTIYILLTVSWASCKLVNKSNLANLIIKSYILAAKV